MDHALALSDNGAPVSGAAKVAARRIDRAVFLALPALIYTAAYVLFRPFGAPLLVFVVFCSGLSAIAFGRVVAISRLWPFAVLATAQLALSLAQWMPASWTVYHDNFAAIRHFSWLVILPFAATSFYIIFTRHKYFIIDNSFYILIFLVIISRSSRFSTSLELSDDELYFLYTLNNDTALIYAVFSLWLFTSRIHWFAKFVSILIIFALSSSTQSQVLVLVLFLIWATGKPKTVVWSLVFALGIFISAAPFHYGFLHDLDPNTGIRALLWFDTLRAVQDTFGMGVGYGTEYIQNNFTELKHSMWRLTGDRLFIGTHSAVYDILLRNGIFGLIAFLFWYIPIYFAPKNIERRAKNVSFSLLAILAINNFVNMGFTSINFLFASAMCIGVVLSIVRHGLPDAERL